MLYVLLGSERGFCGGFNESILKRFGEIVSEAHGAGKAVVVGRKLASKLEDKLGFIEVAEILDGPSAAEEIAGSITDLVRCLTRYPKAQWTLIYHENGDTHGNVAVTCPFALMAASKQRHDQFPPLLNLPPRELYSQIFEQYLFSVLYRASLSFIS